MDAMNANMADFGLKFLSFLVFFCLMISFILFFFSTHGSS